MPPEQLSPEQQSSQESAKSLSDIKGELEKAIENENFEKAIELRDERDKRLAEQEEATQLNEQIDDKQDELESVKSDLQEAIDNEEFGVAAELKTTRDQLQEDINQLKSGGIETSQEDVESRETVEAENTPGSEESAAEGLLSKEEKEKRRRREQEEINKVRQDLNEMSDSQEVPEPKENEESVDTGPEAVTEDGRTIPDLRKEVDDYFENMASDEVVNFSKEEFQKEKENTLYALKDIVDGKINSETEKEQILSDYSYILNKAKRLRSESDSLRDDLYTTFTQNADNSAEALWKQKQADEIIDNLPGDRYLKQSISQLERKFDQVQ